MQASRAARWYGTLGDSDEETINLQRAQLQRASMSLIRRLIHAGPPQHMRDTSDRSACGGMLENARCGIKVDQSSSDWARAQQAESAYILYALLDGMWREIDREAAPLDIAIYQASCKQRRRRRKRTAHVSELLGRPDVFARQGGLCLEGRRDGGLCRNPLAVDKEGQYETTCATHRDRVPPLADGRRTRFNEWAIKERAEIIDESFKPRGRRVQGETLRDGEQAVAWYKEAPTVPLDDHVVVVGDRWEAPSNREVAEQLFDDFTINGARHLAGMELVPSARAETIRCGALRDYEKVAPEEPDLLTPGAGADEQYHDADHLAQEERRHLGLLVPAVTERQVRSAIERFGRIVRASDFFRLIVDHREARP